MNKPTWNSDDNEGVTIADVSNEARADLAMNVVALRRKKKIPFSNFDRGWNACLDYLATTGHLTPVAELLMRE